MENPSTYFLPDGPKNMLQLFSIDWNNVDEYYVQLKDNSDAVIVTTTVNNICGCCDDEKVRVMFLNYLGTWDCLNFMKPKIVHEDTSSEFQKGLGYPLQKADTGYERFDVRSTNTYQATVNLTEKDMVWIQELKDSPKAFIEWIGIEGQPDDYLPIEILADKMDKQKNVDEYRYQFTMQFKLANDPIILRN